MSYNSNKSYGNSISYSFSSSTSGVSEYTLASNQMEYSNNSVVSYSGNPNINYNSALLSNNVNRSGNRLGSNRNYVGNVSGRGTGMSKGSGRGIGEGRGIGNKGQGCIDMQDMQNQLIADQENNFPLTEIDLAIRSLNLSDSPQNQLITQEFTQLEIIHHKEITIVKKAISKQEHLEVIIKKVEWHSKKYKENIIR